MSRISKDPLVRMNEILDAAESLFHSKGYGATAVSDIVKSIEVSQSIFYKYFASKEAVLEAIVNRHLSKIYCELEDITESECTPPQKFEQMVYATFNNLRNGDGVMFDFLKGHKHLLIMDKFVRQGTKMFEPLTKKIIEEGNQAGFFKATHIDEARELIAAVLSCICYSIYQNRSEEQLAWLMEIAGDMLASALGLEKDSLHLKV